MSGTVGFRLVISCTDKLPADLAQRHPVLTHLWAATHTGLLNIKLAAAGAAGGPA